MKEKWYNKKLSIKYIYTIVAIIFIYLKTGEIIHIENETRSYERAQEIYDSMINNDNFSLKGNYWRSLFDNY